MKILKYQEPKSSFLSIEKDMGIIVNGILKNDNLKKLLYYTTKDCLTKPKLTEEQSLELFEKNIKNVPKLYTDEDVLNYIVVNFDSFIPNDSNPEFRDNIIEFDVICHYDQWQLKDFQLRPLRIAAELDVLFNEKHLSGIGTLKFLGAEMVTYTDEFAGVCLVYYTVHGEDDKKFAPNPITEEINLENFNNMFNNDEDE
jgi:hypothetical protein